MRKYVAVAAAATAVVGLANAANATAYSDFAQFQAAAGILTSDGFEFSPWVANTPLAQPTTSYNFQWTAANTLYVGATGAHLGTGSLTSLDSQTNDAFDLLQALVPAGVTAVGGFITTFGQAHDVTLSAYDAANNLIETAVATMTSFGSYSFLGLTTSTPIARIVFASTSVTNPIGDDFNLDDFVFGAAGPSDPPPASDVPAPASLLMLGTALAGLGLMRRGRA